MSWNELTIGKRIGVGFGVVIVLLVLLGVLSFAGVGGIVKNASEVIDGKALDGTLAQREVDHLNWANAVNDLLSNDQVHELSVETDYTKCGFGRWLYGEGRHRAEMLIPSLAPLFKEIEIPHKQLHDSAIQIKSAYTRADTKLPEFIARKEIDHLNWTAAIRSAILENRPAIEVQTDHTQCGFGKWLYGDKAAASAKMDATLAKLLEEIKIPHQQLHETAVQLKKRYHPSHPGVLVVLLESLDEQRQWAASITDDIMAFDPKLSVSLEPDQTRLGRWLASDKAGTLVAGDESLSKFVESIKDPYKELYEIGRQIDLALKQGAFNLAEQIYNDRLRPSQEAVAGIFMKAIHAEQELEEGKMAVIDLFKTQTLPKLEETREILRRIGARSSELLEGYHTASRIYATQTVPALKSVQLLLHKLRKEAGSHILTDQAMLAAAKGTKRNVAIVSAIAIIAGLGLGFIISRGIVLVLNRVTGELDQGAAQVSSASSQIAGSSQSLAEGASQQAASLEETSSSLEEMTSMTRRNADNAANANSLTRDSRESVNASMASMAELTRAMGQITNASEETSKIVKTIDEIAFQTNLLALNAAVEAARAGEAGAGFAVVADEVRNLAMRAAEAAKNTSELIQDTTGKVAQGAGLVENTSQVFQKVRENTGKVAEIMDEISAASREQSQGIDQIANAVSQMDKVTQQNAANAEESASASEEMNAQAEQMKAIVGQLVKLVGGSGMGGLGTGGSGAGGPKMSRKNPDYLPEPGKTLSGYDAGKTKQPVRSKEIRPEQVIPLDEDEDFKDF